MTTLPPPNTREFSESTREKKAYNLVEKFAEYLPIANDRNRLGYGLFKYLEGEGDPPAVLLRSSKLKIEGITIDELAKKLSAGLENLA
jgi:hypothetical protein